MHEVMRSRPTLANALSVILPTVEETLLLRACLNFGPSAHKAWNQWQAQGSGNGFIGSSEAIKSIRPLVFNAVRNRGFDVDKESQTYLRSAYLREELRSKIFRRICRQILLLLKNEDIPAIVLKGTALAETVYDSPVLRHCHDIELLIRNEDISRAASLLASLRFRRVSQKPKPGSNFKLDHESGLPLELHSALFQADS